MSAIVGIYEEKREFGEQRSKIDALLQKLSAAMVRRGPQNEGSLWFSGCTLSAGVVPSKKGERQSAGNLTAKTLSSQIEAEQVAANFTAKTLPSQIGTGQMAAEFMVSGKRLGIVLDGEIYNCEELADEISQNGIDAENLSGAKLILAGYVVFGLDFFNKINGVFAGAVYDEKERSLILFRDPFGVKPLFYSRIGEQFVFASEPKAILAHPEMEAVLNLSGLQEIFAIGPARTPGTGIFKGLNEVRPGCLLSVQGTSFREIPYWTLEAKEHKEDYAHTVETVRELLIDAVSRQMKTGVPLCSFLSGGIDSSLVSSICALEKKKQNGQLVTYSFDFEDNDKNFKANAFQPSLDAPYVQEMVKYLGSDHRILLCNTKLQADGLLDSIASHDLPNMADVDSSLVYFCSRVAPDFGAAMTGECADEIFAGYPWYHKEESLRLNTFPWTKDLDARKVLLSDGLIDSLHMEEYVLAAYETSVSEAPLLASDNEETRRRRQLSWLNLRWFMQTLLNRMDRAGAYTGLSAKVPFADRRIVEYLYNVPWEMKAPDGRVKGLLRDAAKGLLPEEIRNRRKSPYPKTYDLGYEKLLGERVREMMADPSAPVMDFLDKKKLERFLLSPSDYGKPWYGQLMAAPQMLAYVWQINEWMKRYKISVRI